MNKSEFRKKSLIKLRKIAKSPNRYKIDKIIIQKIYNYIKKINAKNLMLYIPLEIEVDIMPLIVRLRREKRDIFVPFMEGKSFRLVKYRLPLEVKKFRVKEPRISREYNKKIDLAIVPIVGTDKSMRRVGFGKGMYDRFYEKKSKNIKKTVFVMRILSYSRDIITDDYDVQGEIVISNSRSMKLEC
ncbi:5-formyltetrahydrofolate cyclo-ligase [hydrothermal vent metagenome]|uniref:5-formyltetrahydrofolate cyclo-ligase n=1 Tax=hydrothermal vent metagenome TaxID=652676 RepID=A0A1W1EHZ2_9ZZZZ